MRLGRTLPGDWHPGVIPDNVVCDDDVYIETSLSFQLCRSQATVGVSLGQGTAVYASTMFDLGHQAQVTIGKYVMLNGARIISDGRLEIGDYTLISWQVVLMDTYRVPLDCEKRRCFLKELSLHEPRYLDADMPAHPIQIGCNVWIGFDACILPGVTIGDGSIVGARSVVIDDVPPYTVVAGNPARIVRQLDSGGVNDV